MCWTGREPSPETDATGAWHVRGLSAAEIGDLAKAEGIGLHELTPLRTSLEDAYSDLVAAGAAVGAGARDGDERLEAAR